MRDKKERIRRALAILELVGVGLFYIGMLALFLYPILGAALYLK